MKNQPYMNLDLKTLSLPMFHFRARKMQFQEWKHCAYSYYNYSRMRANPDVINWENINVVHNERKRRIGEEEERVLFDYVLMCNKICGAGHSNMQLKVIVETQEEFNNWIENNGDNKRLTFSGQEVSWTKTKEQASL